MRFRSGRHFLQIPGPTNVPDRVLRAIERPTIDHRGPDFALLGRVTKGMEVVKEIGELGDRGSGGAGTPLQSVVIEGTKVRER